MAIKRYAEQIIDLASELGIQADALADVDPDIASAEAASHLRDAQRFLNAAKDALTMAIARQVGDTVSDSE
jgi:hypothetical protein